MFQRILTIVFGLFWLGLGLSYFTDIEFLSEFLAVFEITAREKMSQSLGGTDYLLSLIHGVQAITGLCLIFGRFTALSLLALFPITLNIVLYDFFLKPDELFIGIIIAAFHIILLVFNYQTLAPLLHWDN